MIAEANEIQRKSDPPPSFDGSGREPKLLKDQDWAKDIVETVRHFDVSDKGTRDKQIRKWRKQMCYWDSLQYLWWSDVIHDWRTPAEAIEDFSGNNNLEMDPALYAKVINIYRAHGEIIISAMSATTPKIMFPPEDADNPDDVMTARAYTKLAEVIQRHNYADLLMVKALFILYNQGLVCAYNDNQESAEFGTIQEPIKGEVNQRSRNYYCPDCGMDLGSENLGASGEGSDSVIPEPEPEPEIEDEQIIPDGPPPELDEMAPEMEELGMTDPGMDSPANLSPDNVRPPNNSPAPPLPEGIESPNVAPLQDAICPNCSGMIGTEKRVAPEFEDVDSSVEEILGFEERKKCREIITFWGPLNVKVPSWVRRISDSPYLILETEEHYAKMQHIYPEIAEFIKPSENLEQPDRVVRTPTNYQGDTPSDLVTVRRCWLRPWAYNTLGLDDGEQEAKVDRLKSMFKGGTYVVIINDDLLAEAVPDKLDDHWTLTHNPLSDTIHAQPLGEPLMHVQELTNELVNLEVESVEHSIPEVFADTDTLDFDQYNKSEARPGMTYPVTRLPGEALGSSFHEIRGGALGQEARHLSDKLEKMSQFVVGSLPSVWGGQIKGGSNTAREYETSRKQALQRLSTTWRLVTTFWTQVMEKSVKSYAANMISDEKYTKDKGGGTYVNIWVKKAQMTGRVGEIYAESSESFPVSWNEKRSIFLSLMESGNPAILEMLQHPENAAYGARLVGLPELYIPGDEDRNKQLAEIAQMIQEQPIEVPKVIKDEMGQPVGLAPNGETEVMPSVEIEVDLDNHVIEAETCAIWLKGDIGQDAKKNNPAAYMNVLAHRRLHLEQAAKEAMSAMQDEAQAGGEEEGEGSASGKKEEVGAM